MHPDVVHRSSMLNTAEAARFRASIERHNPPGTWERLTIFPLHGITPAGVCACSKADCGSSPGKHPIPYWGEDKWPNGTKPTAAQTPAGLGLATGARSDTILVIDVDVHSGGFASMETLEATLGALPETLTVRGPSGGLHLYFRHPGKFQTKVNGVGQGVDLKGEGGYAVMPGSPHKLGGHYTIEDDAPIAMLPPAWADALPRAGDRTHAAPRTPDYVPADPHTLRERLASTVKGKKGPTWAALRRAVKGERMFRIQGGPGSGEVSLVVGVHNFMREMIWDLVRESGWHNVPPEDMAELVAGSLGTLRSDAAAVGGSSKWTREHFQAQWHEAACKLAGEHAEADAFLASVTASALESSTAKASIMPLALQMGRNAFFVLDDRNPARPIYEGPVDASMAVPVALKVWEGKPRILERETEKGRRYMTAGEFIETHGVPITRLRYDLGLTTPKVEDLDLVMGPRRELLPDPVMDAGVAAWLDLLGGPALLDWIAWACPERAETTVPALALIGGAHVGKSMLADGLARAAGLLAVGALKTALGKFASTIAHSPILFSDEGIPRGDKGQPLTEEFRALMTSKDRMIEVKHVDKMVSVHGAVRVVLAANRVDRLFSNRGNLGAADVAAITRRLLVVEIEGDEKIEACGRAVASLGPGGEGCPIRLARVAGHFRWLQTTRVCPAPAPSAALVQRELRRGGDVAREALEALDDNWDTVDWICVDEGADLLWFRPEMLARNAGTQGGAGPLMRALLPYVVSPNTQRRTHPVTGASLGTRERWVGLSLSQVRADEYVRPAPVG